MNNLLWFIGIIENYWRYVMNHRDTIHENEKFILIHRGHRKLWIKCYITVSYSAVWVYPLYTRLQGWPVLAFCTLRVRTENLTVNSPTLQPLNHVVDEFSVQMMVYMPQNILKPHRNRNLKIKKIDFSRYRTCRHFMPAFTTSFIKFCIHF